MNQPEKSCHFLNNILIVHNNEFQADISTHVYNALHHIHSHRPLLCLFAAVPFLFPIFQQEDSVCVLHPLEDTELYEKAGFSFSSIKIIAFKHEIMSTLGCITNFKA